MFAKSFAGGFSRDVVAPCFSGGSADDPFGTHDVKPPITVAYALSAPDELADGAFAIDAGGCGEVLGASRAVATLKGVGPESTLRFATRPSALNATVLDCQAGVVSSVHAPPIMPTAPARS